MEPVIHPNVHQPWQQWSHTERLHVACAYSNPFRWRTRRELMNNFRYHLEQSPNVSLYVGELAYGDRPHEVTTPDNPRDFQLRTGHELFHKENILNAVIRRFPAGWKYGMICDADFHFTRHDWALETIHQLQHYHFVQPYSSYLDVSGSVYGTAQLPTRANSTFFFNYIQNGFQISPQYFNGKLKTEWQKGDPGYESVMSSERYMRGIGATGGALAFRRESLDMVGGLLDRCILGHADWYMAFSLVGLEAPDIHTQNYSPDYVRYVRHWRERAESIKRNVGYVDGMAVHYFHGSKIRRAYSSRDKILAARQYSPSSDVFPDWQGIYQLNPEKPELRDDIRQYFVSRSEDDPNLYGSERLMV